MRTLIDRHFELFLSMMQEKFSSNFESNIDGDLFKKLRDEILYALYYCHAYVDRVVKDPHMGDLFSPSPDAREYTEEDKALVKVVKNVEAVLMFYYGKPLDIKTRLDIVWRFASCYTHLKKGNGVLADFKPIQPDWYAVRIEDARFVDSNNQDGKIIMMVELGMRLVDGPFGGLTFKQRIPYKFLVGSFANDLGFRRAKNLTKSDFVCCQFLGLLDTNGEYPKVVKFGSKQSQRALNRGRYKIRHATCHYGFSWPCADCSLGHSIGGDWSYGAQSTRCIHATHSATYLKKLCPECLKEGFFDPLRRDKSCLGCTEAKYENWAKFLQEHE